MLAHAYEYILAIAHSKTLTQAAQSLYISQPALTKYINRLEQDLGIKLINRNQAPILSLSRTSFWACSENTPIYSLKCLKDRTTY